MCDCNNSPFTKLRQSWSDPCKNTGEAQCACCCQSPTTNNCKVKGKFGVAYIIETPTRKCKPCGWQVEFNDTPSKIENNCKKMMNWITCPPLGECQNNSTQVCCCCNPAKEACCKPDKNTCGCCKGKKTSSGDCRPKSRPCCCCPKEPVEPKQCCCNKKKSKKPRCCRALNGQQAYIKSKIKKCSCCEDQNPCECQSEEKNCCCCKDTKPQTSCCCNSDDSESSSVEECCCKARNKTKRKCNCKCSEDDKRSSKQKPTQSAAVQKSPKDKADGAGQFPSKPSKNLLSPSPEPERHKTVAKSPFTMNSSVVTKKAPDIAKNVQEELSKNAVEAVEKSQKSDAKPDVIKKQDYPEVSPQENKAPQVDKQPQVVQDSQPTSYGTSHEEVIKKQDYPDVPPQQQENRALQVDKQPQVVQNNQPTSYGGSHEEVIKKQDYPDVPPQEALQDDNKPPQVQNNQPTSDGGPDEEELPDEQLEEIYHLPDGQNDENRPPGRKKVKRENLIKLIKERHKREMEAIHPTNTKTTLAKEGLQPR